jgi:hypothetical protein
MIYKFRWRISVRLSGWLIKVMPDGPFKRDFAEAARDVTLYHLAERSHIKETT